MEENPIPEHIRTNIRLNRALGFAIGALSGLRYQVDATMKQKIDSILEAIERIETPAKPLRLNDDETLPSNSRPTASVA